MAQAFAWAVSLRAGTQARFNNETGPGKNWWRGFRSRHPELSLRTADNLERSRACALTREVVDKYFACLKTTLENNGLTNAPRQLFNCDETFLPLNIPCSKVIARKNARHVYAQSRGTSEHITLLCCASAAGIAHPPMIIYSKFFPGGNYRFDGPDDALYARSESGWIDSELFLLWMKKVFLRHCGSQRPIILFVDGHVSHITLNVIDLARENDVILFCLPPHTTHALQPLDVSFFRSLKSNFSKVVHDIFMTVHADEANDKRTSRRITGVRVLTSNDYVEIMKEKDRKVKEAAELKQKRKEERELKKIEKEKEREQKKKELEEKRRNKKERGKGKNVSATVRVSQVSSLLLEVKMNM